MTVLEHYPEQAGCVGDLVHVYPKRMSGAMFVGRWVRSDIGEPRRGLILVGSYCFTVEECHTTHITRQELFEPAGDDALSGLQHHLPRQSSYVGRPVRIGLSFDPDNRIEGTVIRSDIDGSVVIIRTDEPDPRYFYYTEVDIVD